MSRQPRVSRLPLALPEQGASANWLAGIRFSGFSALTLGMIVLFIVVLAPSLRVFVEQRQEIAALEAEVDEHRTMVEDMQQDVARWDDPSYVEAQARERLYYVKPGEFSYLVIDDGATLAAPATAQPISDSIQTTRVDWVSGLLSSVVTAGVTEQTPEQIIAPVIEGSGQ